MDEKERPVGEVVKLKFCGLKSQADIDFCSQNVAYMGFVFEKSSPRFIEYEDFASLNLQGKAKTVAVFKGASVSEIRTVIGLNRVDYVQIHDECVKVMSEMHGIVGFIKAFGGSAENIDMYKNLCEYFLFDSSTPGAGLERDFASLKNLYVSKEFFVAGGINLLNIKKALDVSNMLDISSGIEEVRGVKSLKKMREIVDFVKNIS